MPALLHSPPLIEPISLEEAKQHLKIDINADDELISRLIVTARQHVETISGLVLIEQTWRAYFNNWPTGQRLGLPVMPISTIIFVKTYTQEGLASEIDPAHYYADTISTPPQLILRQSRSWVNPDRLVNGIEVEVVAGFGPLASDVPQPLRQAILMLVAHWYDNRHAVCEGQPTQDINAAIENLIAPFKVKRL